jgi:pyruvate kinase
MAEIQTPPIRKTKIIVTLGEKSSSKEMLVELIKAGMDVARISSRFLKIDKQEVLNNLREAMAETQTQVGVMVGLRESDIRIGTFGKTALRLKKNDIVRISTHLDDCSRNSTLWCNNKEFSSLVHPGDKLLVDFGKIILTVITEEYQASKSESCLQIPGFLPDEDSSKIGNIMYMLNSTKSIGNSISSSKALSFNDDFQRPKRQPKGEKVSRTILCRVENDCILSVHKPVLISSSGKTETPVSDVTAPEDFKLIEWANENEIDFIVIKQVRSEEDMNFIINLADPSAKKILGVQNKDSLEMFDQTIQGVDGVVIGRGTLALETSLADVCRVQKKIVKKCNELSKPVIISTQLLESMVYHNSPTRSEVTDVTNAVLDGADALLLSGETAYGHDPIRAFLACARICVEAERHLNYSDQCEKIKKILGKNITITENTCYSAVTTVLCTDAKVIVCLTESGRTAQIISRFMPPCAIVALTNSRRTERTMKIMRGVHPFFVTESDELELLMKIFDIVKREKFAVVGDNIVLVGGLLQNFAAGNTCTLKILTVR